MELTDAGAHMDSVNAQGETPFEAATTGNNYIIPLSSSFQVIVLKVPLRST